MCRQLNSYNGFPLEKVTVQGLGGPAVLLVGTVLTGVLRPAAMGRAGPAHGAPQSIALLAPGCWEGGAGRDEELRGGR